MMKLLGTALVLFAALLQLSNASALPAGRPSAGSPISANSIDSSVRQRWPCPDREKPYLTPGCSSLQYVAGGQSTSFVAASGLDLYVNKVDPTDKTAVKVYLDCGNSSIHPPTFTEDRDTCYPIVTVKPQPRLCEVFVEPAGVRLKMFGCVPPTV